MNSDITLRLERYFRDPIIGNSIFKLGDESVAIANIKRALKLLGYYATDGNEYDLLLKNTILNYQESKRHVNTDGWFGPGTRRLLTQDLYSK